MKTEKNQGIFMNCEIVIILNHFKSLKGELSADMHKNAQNDLIQESPNNIFELL